VNAESIALLIDDSNRFESNLSGFLAKLHGNIDASTYEALEEQVKDIRKSLWEFKDLILNLDVSIQ
jgi:hypothetical protein